jgi:hypothetical protein
MMTHNYCLKIEDSTAAGCKSRPRPGSMGFVIATVAVLLLLSPVRAWSESGQSAAAQAPDFIQGKLEINAGGAAKLASPAGPVALNSENFSLLHTLEDSRLNGREVRLEGDRKPDGSFEVRHLYTVHGGKLFRLRYYCHVCNIAATEPGNCVCCQRPTQLEEIPADEVTDDMVMVP